MIYFVRAGADGLVKIGFSQDAVAMKRRIGTLQTGQPHRLEMLRTIEGSREQEAWLHRFFGDLRVAGEWFEFRQDMLTVEPEGETLPDGSAAVVISARFPLQLLASLRKRADCEHRALTNLILHLVANAMADWVEPAARDPEKSDKAA